MLKVPFSNGPQIMVVGYCICLLYLFTGYCIHKWQGRRRGFTQFMQEPLMHCETLDTRRQDQQNQSEPTLKD